MSNIFQPLITALLCSKRDLNLLLQGHNCNKDLYTNRMSLFKLKSKVLVTFTVCINRAFNMEKKCVSCVPILWHKSKLTKFFFTHYKVLQTCINLFNHITNFQVVTMAHTRTRTHIYNVIHEGHLLYCCRPKWT